LISKWGIVERGTEFGAEIPGGILGRRGGTCVWKQGAGSMPSPLFFVFVGGDTSRGVGLVTVWIGLDSPADCLGQKQHRHSIGEERSLAVARRWMGRFEAKPGGKHQKQNKIKSERMNGMNEKTERTRRSLVTTGARGDSGLGLDGLPGLYKTGRKGPSWDLPYPTDWKRKVNPSCSLWQKTGHDLEEQICTTLIRGTPNIWASALGFYDPRSLSLSLAVSASRRC